MLSRLRSGAFLIAEDARLMGRPPADTESDFVRRCANVWRNDTENLPFFLAIALTYVLLGASTAQAQVVFAAFVLLRFAHTAVFLLGLQPWRAVCYLSGLAVCWFIAAQCLWLAAARAAAS